jgi:hypothetical protein
MLPIGSIYLENVLGIKTLGRRSFRVITELRLSQFQGFGSNVTVPFKPLTLIYGPNASGKSSIMRALLLAKQSLPKDSHSILRRSGFSGFVYEGDLVSLASFANTVFKHETSAEIDLGFKLPVPSEILWKSPTRKVVEEVGFNWKLSSTMSFSALELTYKFFGVHSPLSIVFNRREDVLRIQDIKLDNEVLGTLRELYAHSVGKISRNNDPETKLPNVTEEDFNSFAKSDFKSDSFMILGNLPRVFTPSSRLTKIQKPANQMHLALLEELIQTSRLALSKSFENLIHIKPLREIDHRFTYEGEDLAGDFELGATNSNINTELISDWMQNLTEGRYRFKTLTYVADEIKYLGRMKSHILLDTWTDTPVSFRDVGVGLSQIKPILSALAFASENPQSTLLIEQPELHLHPAMQASLTSLLVGFTNANPGMQIIAETHSESILHRVQKCLREGTLKEDQVQILYVDRSSKEEAGNTISEVDLSSENGYSFDLPLSFSDLRFLDLI